MFYYSKDTICCVARCHAYTQNILKIKASILTNVFYSTVYSTLIEYLYLLLVFRDK